MAADRKEQILTAVDAFLLEHVKWAENPERTVPDGKYFTAMGAVFNIYDAESLPYELRETSPIGAAIAELRVQQEEYDRIQEETGKFEANGNFWRAREALQVARHAPAPDETPLEPVKDLFDQGVSDRQIARMYNLFHPVTKDPLTAKVSQERRNPGTVPELQAGYESQHKRSIREAEEKASSQYQVAAKQVASSAEPLCPESSEELYYQGVPVKQAARMLQRTEADVQEEWDVFASNPAADETEGPPTKSNLPEPIISSSEAAEWSSLSNKELRDLCTSEGISVRSNSGRAVLIAKLETVSASAKVGG